MPQWKRFDEESAVRATTVNKVIQEQLHFFEKNFDSHPINCDQDVRSALVCLLALYVPEFFQSKTISYLKRTVQTAHEFSDYNNDGWYKIITLEAALFALTAEKYYTNTITKNLDHHNTSLREYCQNVFLMISHKFNLSDVATPIISNFLSMHLGNENSLAIIVSLADNWRAKERFLRFLLESRISDEDRKLIIRTLKFRSAANTYGSAFVQDTLAWCFARFAGIEFDEHPVINWRLHDSDDADLFSDLGALDVRSLWRRITRLKNHRPVIHL